MKNKKRSTADNNTGVSKEANKVDVDQKNLQSKGEYLLLASPGKILLLIESFWNGICELLICELLPTYHNGNSRLQSSKTKLQYPQVQRDNPEN